MKKNCLAFGNGKENARGAGYAPGTFKRFLFATNGLFAAAHEAQQEQEHVDEVEIQAQRAHDHGLAGKFGTAQVLIFALQALRVIGGKAGENQHADEAHGERQRARLQEDVDHAGDDQADHAHDQECTHALQVLLGGVAEQAETGEGPCRGEEGRGDAFARIDEEDRRQRQAHHRGEGPEHQLQRSLAELVHAEAHREDEAQRRQRNDPHQRTAGEGQRQAAARGQHGDQSGQQHARSHIIVNLEHVGAQARIEGFLPGNGVASARHRAEALPLVGVVPIGHVSATPFGGAVIRAAPGRNIGTLARDFKRNRNPHG